MYEEVIKFVKLREGAIIPSKREEDAGYDIYANFEEESVTILPGEIKLIPTGIASVFSSDFGMLIRERGSTGFKGLSLRAGVIDSGYRGEWIILLNNTTSSPICISKKEAVGDGVIHYPYTKAIAQAILVSMPKVEVKEISLAEFGKYNSERGIGKLGSSGK